MKFYVYCLDSCNGNHGQYELEMYPADDYSDKSHFYRECINSDCEIDEDVNEEIYLIDVDVDDKIRMYYFDGYECLNDDVVFPTYLGEFTNFYKYGSKEYTKIIREHTILRSNVYVIIVGNGKYQINNIDKEGLHI